MRIKRQMIRKKKERYEVEVTVLLKQEDGIWVAYCPALELSSYGDTKADAEKAFNGALSIFLRETEKRGSLERELIQLGWVLSKEQYEPPSIPSNLINFLSDKPVQQIRECLTLPA